MKNILLVVLVTTLFNVDLSIQSTQPIIHIVKIEDMKFVPETIEIKTGETVRWINLTNNSHNIFAKDKSFKSKMLYSKGDSYEYTFKKEGSSEYYCQPHKIMGMNGNVNVRN